jgi:hypothetical protein
MRSRRAASAPRPGRSSDSRSDDLAEVGDTSRFHYDYADVGPDQLARIPVAGDFLRSPAGSCYLIEDVRPSPTIRGRAYLTVTKLERDAVQFGEPGVWPIHWHKRERRRRPVTEGAGVEPADR